MVLRCKMCVMFVYQVTITVGVYYMEKVMMKVRIIHLHLMPAHHVLLHLMSIHHLVYPNQDRSPKKRETSMIQLLTIPYLPLIWMSFNPQIVLRKMYSNFQRENKSNP